MKNEEHTVIRMDVLGRKAWLKVYVEGDRRFKLDILDLAARRVGAGAAQHDRHAVIHTGHDLMKQLTAFFDGHHREFTVGAANQQTVITQTNYAFNIFT